MDTHKNKKYGFTFVELIVAVTILAILTTIGFVSYTSSLGDSRDSQRKSDIASIKAALNLYKQGRGLYPYPGDYFTISVGATDVAYQGVLNNSVAFTTLDKIPTDPKTKYNYLYSVTLDRQQHQLSLALENTDDTMALLEGDYRTVSKNVLPTIMLATGSITSIDTTAGTNDTLFIFNEQTHNLPYDFLDNNFPTSDGTSLATLLSDAEANATFWQNTDYRNCTEIDEAGASIGDGEYQILSSTGALSNTGCTF